MNRNAEALSAKAKLCAVTTRPNKTSYDVKSPSGQTYLVVENGVKLECNCKFALYNAGSTGCAHTLAVTMHKEARKVRAHNGKSAAVKQHRSTRLLGQDLYITLR
jgi:hypothetical protein